MEKIKLNAKETELKKEIEGKMVNPENFVSHPENIKMQKK